MRDCFKIFSAPTRVFSRCPTYILRLARLL
jgi:hypothetical protein